MTETPVRRARRTTTVAGAIASGAALVLAGFSPASAAEVQIGPDDVAGFENGDEDSAGYNYDQWHVGSTTNPDVGVEESLAFRECSVTFGPPVDDSATVTQLLKGFPIDERPDTLEEITAFFDTLAVDMESGSVTLQVPLFVYGADDEDLEDPDFTTLRNAEPFTEAGTYTLEGEPLVGTGPAGEFDSPEEFLEGLADAIDEGTTVQVLGFGVTGAEDSVVNALGVLDDVFFFGEGDCVPTAPGGDDDDVDDEGAGAVPQAPTRPVAVETGR